MLEIQTGVFVTFEEINELVLDHVKMISISKKSLGEAIERAAEFLVVTAILVDYKRELEIDKTKLTTLQEAKYSQSIKRAEGKTITEKKISVSEDTGYTDVREQVEEIEAGISWAKSYIKIFENAHLTYRQQSRD